MKTITKTYLLALLLLTLSLAQVFGSPLTKIDIPAKPVKLSATTLEKDGPFLVVNYENHPGWHTYWKNPGDAGLPIRVEFKLDGKPFQLQDQEWPVPKKYIEEGGILAFGYQGSYSLFFSLKDKLNELHGKILKIESKWLVCKHICIPGQGEVQLKFDNGKATSLGPNELEVDEKELIDRFENLPKNLGFPPNLDIVLMKSDKENQLLLTYTVTGIEQETILSESQNLLTPFPILPFDFKKESIFKDKKNNLYGKQIVGWDGEYQEPEIPLPKDGSFKSPYSLKFLYKNPLTNKTQVVEKKINSFNLEGATSSENFFKLLAPVTASGGENGHPNKGLQENKQKKSDQEKTSLLTFILLAFLGGLILNVMPCVLPVISLKLFGLLAHSQDKKKEILAHNIFYTLGILISFIVLGLIIISIKSAGEMVGWGFQLQSPKFVAVMIFVIFLFSLNLFGLFEFRTPGGNILGDIQLKKGYGGDFLSGILATILSTPCSAPFLGTALTFAFSSSSFDILLIFTFIGLGLAFPFILTGLFPKLISFLPKPGKWMENVKKFLGLTLILTSIWLMDVFLAQTDSSIPSLKLNTALATAFFAFYMAKNITKKYYYLFPIFLISFAFLVSILVSEINPLNGNGKNTLLLDKKATGLDWEKWSVEKMEYYKKLKKPVFIDFTAKWCFTCKVNEKLVLETKTFKEFIKENNIKLLLADWTKRDLAIGKWLQKNGKVGVPAYFVIRMDGTLVDLGETISISEIKEAL